MFLRFRKIFQLPTVDEPDKNRRAQLLNTIFIGLLLISFLGIWLPIIFRGGIQLAIAIFVLGLLIVLYVLLRTGRIALASRLLPLVLWVIAAGSMFFYGGIRNPWFSSFAIIIVVASFILGPRVGLFYTTITLIFGGLLVLIDNLGILPPLVQESSITIFISSAFTLLGVGFLLYLVRRNIDQDFQSSRLAEKNAKDALSALEQVNDGLKHRSDFLEERNSILQFISAFNHISSNVETESALLDQGVSLVARNLHVDHVAIFLTDESNENAVLRATNSEEGKSLLDRNYSVKISFTPQIYASAEMESVKFQATNRALYITPPSSVSNYTKSISLPLSLGGELLGLLNLQFSSADRWQGNEDALGIVAYYIALTLNDFRLTSQGKQMSREIDRLTGEFTQSAWKTFTQQRALGFLYDQVQVIPKSEVFPNDVFTELANLKSASYKTSGDSVSSRLIAPITLRGQSIGVIGYENPDPNYEWSPSEKAMLETIATRVALALENSRLVADAEQRADREQVVGQIASRMRETLDLDTILQTTLEELHRSFELEEAEIRLQSTQTDNKED